MPNKGRVPHICPVLADVGYHCSFPLTLDSSHALSGQHWWNPTSREKRARYPDFLYAAPSNIHVCGFHRGKPHEVHQRQQTSQEIRGYGGTRPSLENQNL